MTRILMIAAFVFLALNSDAQSEIYGGVGGPYTPMKFVIDIDSITPHQDEVPVNDSATAPRMKEHQTQLSVYGSTLSSLITS